MDNEEEKLHLSIEVDREEEDEVEGSTNSVAISTTDSVKLNVTVRDWRLRSPSD